MPTFVNIIGTKMPTDRPIDGVDQTDVLMGKSGIGHREGLLTLCLLGSLVAPVQLANAGSSRPFRRLKGGFNNIHVGCPFRSNTNKRSKTAG